MIKTLLKQEQIWMDKHDKNTIKQEQIWMDEHDKNTIKARTDLNG